ncbi:MAG: MoaD/ThiS family protein [Candidatus Bathyarchaeota archaeon]|nr:MoaD/ThiS family protein [Candidatus Bathyarchaeota archaeon]MDH5636058.1 MoaD/ThiS family protein [Candidatus Bathyarchaeota archaeon]MDH5702171.1 MoaD/ThiS family protein [Candidatus Bathyarchaeota archaeon]
MVINVEVKFLGIFRQFSGRNRVLVKLEKPATVRKTIEKLIEAFSSEFKLTLVDPELEDARPNALILVNRKEISVLQGLETEVEDGDEIVLVPVSHGG